MVWERVLSSLIQIQMQDALVQGASVPTNTPFNDYTAGVVTYTLLVGVLVTVLLVGGFLILNLGLLSKRKEDRLGGRAPSDVGFLKESVWPEEPSFRRTLPAEESIEEDDETSRVESEKIRKAS